MTLNPKSWSLPDIPMLKSFGQQLVEFNQPYTAKHIFNQLIQRVQAFEAELDQEHEVGMRLVSFGKSTEFSVSRIGYLDPNLIWFQGVLSDKSDVELIQHVSQISFMLIKIKRQPSEEPRCPIGFCSKSSLTADSVDEAPSEITETLPATTNTK
ncbi:DUF6173 family protein [Sporomusa sp.]|uniref:DUF6173 family protein n=1 Tax=Sporomusa sp. TaxID=2078658 RepID=UPI002C50C268|nr:DUF6173 family protein [Sporomusa sp.]HWR43237.1 DUF6173 family protein [Sporomusa sp.]